MGSRLMALTKDDRELCHECFRLARREHGAKLWCVIPDDPENYPRECEECGKVVYVECRKSQDT